MKEDEVQFFKNDSVPGEGKEATAKEKLTKYESREKPAIIMPPKNEEKRLIKRSRNYRHWSTFKKKQKTNKVGKQNSFVTSFSKLRPTEKGRLILKCFAEPSAIFNAINRIKLIEVDDQSKISK